MSLPFQDCVVLFGDSLTSRQDVPSTLHALMADHYRRTLDVVNRGFGGYNTTYARTIFDKMFAKKEQANTVPQIRLVTLWFGTNDACLPHNPMGQHVPLDEYRANLTYFLESLTSASSPFAAAHSPLSIVMITPPAMYRPMLPPVLAEAREEETTKKYVDIVLELAAEWSKKGKEEGKGWRVEGIDLWSKILEDAGGQKEKKMAEYFTDGLHLSTAGYAVLWKEYTKLVRGPLKNRGLDWDDLTDCPPRAPLWDDVDTKDPQSVVKQLKQSPFRSS